jgi:hypothetical protein
MRCIGYLAGSVSLRWRLLCSEVHSDRRSSLGETGNKKSLGSGGINPGAKTEMMSFPFAVECHCQEMAMCVLNDDNNNNNKDNYSFDNNISDNENKNKNNNIKNNNNTKA